MKYQKPRGTIDLIGKDFYKYQKIANTILAVIESYDFGQIRTPMFESLELLKKDAGDEVEGQIYKFKDKGGRELGIKSDITPAIARIVANQGRSMKQPIKFCCYDRVYRYERPKKGRLREITQINAEMFGKNSIEEDAEILECFLNCYLKIGFDDVKIIIGMRPWLVEYLESIGINQNKITKVLRIVDKVDKLDSNEYKSSLGELELSDKQIESIVFLSNLNGDRSRVKGMLEKKGLSPDSTYIQRLDNIFKSLEKKELNKYFEVNLGLARGSDYYTGIIFEATLKGSNVGSIGGGGRYDNLVNDFGNYDIPAVGFSIGVDRLVILLTKR